MLILVLAATLGQHCGTQSYGYGVRYVQPTYAATTYAAPTYVKTVYTAVQYQTPVQQAYQPDYSLVGALARQQAAYDKQVEQAAQIKYLTTLLERQATVQQPAPAPQYQIPYGSPQTPSKATPQYEYPTAPAKNPPAVPSQQYQPAEAIAPLPPLAPSKPGPSPTFSGASAASGWQTQAAVAQSMMPILQVRCTECHAGDATKGRGIQLIAADGQRGADFETYKPDIIRDLLSDRMPQNRTPLTGDEKIIVIRELSGAPVASSTIQARSSFAY